MARHRHSIFDVYQAESPFATEFRRLLRRVNRKSSERDLKTIMVTSAMLSEGKSTVSAFLALTAARSEGMRTLLIDADIRRPSAHKLLGVPREDGLAEVFDGSREFKDVIKPTSLDKLDVITAGRATANPSDNLDAEVIGAILDDMKFYYDLIVVDTAPVLPVSDPMLIAPKVDGILLVVKAGATQKELVTRAIDILDPNHSRMLGIVLNNVNEVLPYYYDHKYYGYSYDSEAVPSGRARSSKRDEQKKTGDKAAARPDNADRSDKPDKPVKNKS